MDLGRVLLSKAQTSSFKETDTHFRGGFHIECPFFLSEELFMSLREGAFLAGVLECLRLVRDENLQFLFDESVLLNASVIEALPL
jgi:hypothetical protein